jgi:TetR/AcrR family transcriptional regulator
MSHPKAKEDTRDRLMAAATPLFAQKGFDGVSVKELADAAGVNVSLISYHFGGKENLYSACLEQFGKARLDAAQRLLQKPQSLDEFRFRIQLFIEEMFACHVEGSDQARILHRECDMEMPIAQEIFRNTFLKVFETLIEFIQAAQDARVIRRDLEAPILTQIFFGSVVHIMRSSTLHEKFYGKSLKDPAYREKMIHHLVSYCILGCVGERAPSSVPALERSPL